MCNPKPSSSWATRVRGMKCDHAVQLCTCCLCLCTVQKNQHFQLSKLPTDKVEKGTRKNKRGKKLWRREQVCSRTINIKSINAGQVQAFSEQAVSKFLTILQQIPFLLPWIGGRQCTVFRLCISVGLFCLPIRNIFPHISLHDLPCHKTMKRCLYQISLNKVAFLLQQQRFWIQTCSCNCPRFLCWFGILFECKPNEWGQRIMSVLPNQRLSWVFSTSD